MPIDTPNTSSQIPPHIVVLSCAASQKFIEKKTLDILCIEPKKHDHTSILHKIDEMHKGLSKLAAPPELSQTEADKRIINPNAIHAWVSSPDGKYYQILIPRDLALDIKHILNIGGMAIELKRLTKNGYNSEFELSSPDKKKWTILGTIFTSKHPVLQMIQNKEKEITEIEKTIASRTQELNQIQKKHLKFLRIKIKRKIKDLNREINSLHSDKQILTTEIAGLRSQTPNLREYISFPYVPYQKSLDTHESHMAGMKHLGAIMTDAYRHLQSLGRMTIIESVNGKETTRSVNTADIPRKAPPELPILLNIIERMGYQVYYKKIPEHREYKDISKKGKSKTISIHFPAQEVLRDADELDTIMAEQVGRALTVFGLNTYDAFSWQRNDKSQALGIGQFIPSTYKNFQYKYSILQKEAGIPSDHETGAKDQRVSMQFQVMHLYDQYPQFPSWIRNNWDDIMADDQARIGIMALYSAGYNGSMQVTLKDAKLNTPGKHTISELYPVNLRGKFTNNTERYTYVLKLEYLFKKFFSEKK